MPKIRVDGRSLSPAEVRSLLRGEVPHPHEPLVREKRLDRGLAPVAVADVGLMLLDPHEQALRLEVLDDLVSRGVSVHVAIGATLPVDPAVRRKDIDHRKAVPEPAIVVVRIMSRSHFKNTCSKIWIDKIIQNNGKFTL